MKKMIFVTGAALLALAGGAQAQTDRLQRPDRDADVTRAQAAERADRTFARLDADSDGRLTREDMQQLREQRGARMADRMFERLDLNRDGSITREEMNQARAQRQAQRAERRAEAGERPGRRGMRGHRGHRGFAMRGGRMFGEQGFVTAEQFRERALARFDRLDANSDGTVTAAERQQARQAMRERVRERRGQAQAND